MGFWEDKKVFITGATGILGSWLTKELVNKGANVTILMRDWVPKSEIILTGLINKVNIVQGCLEDYATIERCLNEYEIDSLFHLGAQTIVGTANRNPLSTFESNIKGTWNILEATRRNELIKRIVVASSDKAYGTHEKLPYKENAKLMGLHPYDASKSCADILAQAYAHTYGMPIAITRCGNIYGGGDLNFNRIIPGTIKSLIFNQRPIIRSDGKYIRDYIFVKDIVDAYLLLAEKLKTKNVRGEAFNFGTEKPISVIELVKIIIKISKKNKIKPIILNKAKGEIKKQYLCTEKARSILLWKPKYSLEEGLRHTYKWYEWFFSLS